MRVRIGRWAAAGAVVTLSVLAVPATPAGAATYYEYWSYWHKAPGATSWRYSSVGPSGYYLQKGSQVEGWRYAVGTASPSDPKPRPTDVSYDQYCGGKNTANTYRVLLVVDYGTASSAPAGPVFSCYGFDAQASGYRVLTQQHTERDNGGLICAIDSYPRTGCGDTVSSPAPRHSSRPPATKPRPTSATTHATTAAGTATVARTPATAATSTPTRTTTAPQPSSSVSPTAASAGASPSSTPAEAATLRPFTGNAASSSSFPTGLVLGIAGLIALATGALWLRRRSP